MKNSLTLLCLIMFLKTFEVSAQRYQKINLAFNISEANNNGINHSLLYQKKEVYVSFYQNEGDSTLYMAVIWPNNPSSSYGPLYENTIKENNELYHGKKTEKSYYQWYFINTYDEKKGWATVELSVIYEKSLPYYVLKIITMDDFEILTYKGYLNKDLTGKLIEIKN